MKASSILASATVWVAVFIPLTLSGCSDSTVESGSAAISQLSAPSSIQLSGTSVNQIGNVNYVFATSAGTIDASGNSVTATFADPFVPLVIDAVVIYSSQMNTGSCSSLGAMPSSVVGVYSNMVTAQLSATGCTDNAQINVLLDTTKVLDLQGYSGTDVITTPVTVDLAPTVSVVATGNTASDGTGTADSMAGQFDMTNDHSLTVTFSKAVSQGQLVATLFGCTATLTSSTGTIVAGSNNTQVAWQVATLPSATDTNCFLNVSTVTDNVNNPVDPSDPYLNMAVTFK